VFESESARTLSEGLATAKLSEQDLSRFANEFSGADDADAGKSLLGAAQSLAAGLGQIKPGSLGLLHVG
jgi:hypothetical protein